MSLLNTILNCWMMLVFKLMLTMLMVFTLVGCGNEDERMTNENIVKDRQYCIDNGYVPHIKRAAWDGVPLYVECKPIPPKPEPVECIK